LEGSQSCCDQAHIDTPMTNVSRNNGVLQ